MIYTFTGKNINPVDLKPEDIDIRDMAHSLACENRFYGHTKFPMSVAQHSIYASYLCEGTGSELQALLHDGSEYIIGDVTKWLKRLPIMAGYVELEDRIQRLIYRVFGCEEEDSEATKAADNLLVRCELLRGYGPEFTVAANGCKYLTDTERVERIKKYPPITQEELSAMSDWYSVEWSWRYAEQRFLRRFEHLTKRS